MKLYITLIPLLLGASLALASSSAAVTTNRPQGGVRGLSPNSGSSSSITTGATATNATTVTIVGSHPNHRHHVVVSGVDDPVNAQLLKAIALQLAADEEAWESSSSSSSSSSYASSSTSPASSNYTTKSIEAKPSLAQYARSCAFFDISCYKCNICQTAYSGLLKTGSQAACDAACVAIVEAAGLGPEDPIADAVAVACVPLCKAVFSAAAGASSSSVCGSIGLC